MLLRQVPIKGKVDFIFTFSEPIKKDTKPNTGGFTLDDIDRTTSNVKFLNQPELDKTVRTDGKEVWNRCGLNQSQAKHTPKSH